MSAGTCGMCMAEWTPTHECPKLPSLEAIAAGAFLGGHDSQDIDGVLARQIIALQREHMEMLQADNRRLDALEGKPGTANLSKGVPVSAYREVQLRAECADQRAEDAERERNEARAALAKYGVHGNGCRRFAVAVGELLGPCTCGLSDALAPSPTPGERA